MIHSCGLLSWLVSTCCWGPAACLPPQQLLLPLPVHSRLPLDKHRLLQELVVVEVVAVFELSLVGAGDLQLLLLRLVLGALPHKLR